MNSTFTELKKLQKKYENRFFCIGFICGLIIGVLLGTISYGISNNNYFIPELKYESNKQLINYIEGKWISAINDVQMTIDINETKELIILELMHDNKIYKKFKITQLTNINGIFGVVTLDICDFYSICSNENTIHLQINKIFGKKDSIIITYDNKLTECTDLTSECVRAFTKAE